MTDSYNINEMILRLLNNEISEEDFARLKQWLEKNPKALSYYCTFLSDYVALRKEAESGLYGQDGILSDSDVWAALAEEEKTAKAVTVQKDPIKPEPIEYDRKAVVKQPRRINKVSLYTAIISTAAFLFMVIYVHFYPDPSGEVATLIDSVNPVWSEPFNGPRNGDRLSMNQGALTLNQGIVKMDFDDGVRVLIEGPAEYEISGRMEIRLYAGQLYAHVTEAGRGFTVTTANSRIVDLGTEFGVQASADGSAELHVYKGKTALLSRNKGSLDVTEGQAKKLLAEEGKIVDIEIEANKFVREIDSKTRFVWKGYEVIHLTDLLAGRIFDADPDGIEINPVTGEHVIHENYVSGIERRGGTDYQKMESPFIDGSFIPQGQPPQTISSTGLTGQFPATSGVLYYNLSDRKSIYDGYTATRYPLLLTPAYQDKPSLLFHPNMGITVDLDKIRQKIPALQIDKFQTDCGIAFSARQALKNAYPDGNIPEQERPSVDFMVLLDGKVQKTLTGITMDSGIIQISTDIQPADRFLTLVATDGNQSHKYDWFVLADPVLEISMTE